MKKVIILSTIILTSGLLANSASAADSLVQLSTGLRINSLSDNASGQGVSNNVNAVVQARSGSGCSNNQVLEQAGVSTLSHANQMPEDVLNLMR